MRAVSTAIVGLVLSLGAAGASSQTVISIALLGSSAAVCEEGSPGCVSAPEAAVYGAYLEQRGCVWPAARDMYSVAGVRKRGFGGPTLVEPVVVLPFTSLRIDRDLARQLPNDAAEAAESLFVRNRERCGPLERFHAGVSYEFMRQAPQSAFETNHPKAAGYLSLSRVGFNQTETLALLATVRVTLDPETKVSRTEPSLTVLRRIDGRWVAGETIPERKPADQINTARCEPRSFGRSFGVGTSWVEVKGLEGDACVIVDSHEIEGAAKHCECRLPVGLGLVDVSADLAMIYSPDISTYCHCGAPKGFLD